MYIHSTYGGNKWWQQGWSKHQDPQSMIIPTVVEKSRGGERAYDIYSRLLEDRIIYFWASVTQESSNVTVAQLLYLEKSNPEKDIIMYVNSPGGSVTAGMAIYDTMQHLKCDIVTVWVGMCASMGSILLTAGTKGKRFMLPHAEVMIHQPLWGVEWQATDIEIHANRIIKMKKTLNWLLAKHSWQKLSKIQKDVERDYFMDAQEAQSYGLIDEILS